jgi:peroxiredoxin (alkyl hydroperoxide reductase subunit C)
LVVPVAKDMKTAEARLKDESLECYDWWFCHKPLKK